MKPQKKLKLKRLLNRMSDPNGYRFDAKDEYSEIFDHEINKINRILQKHEKAREELVSAMNKLDDRHEDFKTRSMAALDKTHGRISDVMSTFLAFETQNSRALSEIRGTIAGIEKGNKGSSKSLDAAHEKLRKEFLKKLEPIVDRLEELGNAGIRQAASNNPIGVGGSRTTYLNGQNISSFDMYGDVNWIPGPGISMTPVNNTTSLQVDVTVAVTGGSGGRFVDNEVVSGSGNLWQLLNVPISGSQHIHAEGQRLTPYGLDYTISGAIVSTVLSWPASSVLADYRV